jgi:thiol-disulfide isomerase/thioredoxin
MNKISFFIITICLAGCFGSEPQKTGKEGKPMPEFSMLLTDSTTWLNTNKLSTGKPTTFFYFSPFCPYCKAQTKEIIEDMDRLKNINFYFISKFPMPNLKAFQKEYQLAKYPNINIGMDTSTFVMDYFEIAYVPYLAIYNKEKKLNKAFIGKIYSSQIKKVAEE